MAKGEDGRHILNNERRANLCKYMNEQHENGKQVSRRMVAEWVKAKTGREMSDLSAGRMLSRLGYKHRGGTYVL